MSNNQQEMSNVQGKKEKNMSLLSGEATFYVEF